MRDHMQENQGAQTNTHPPLEPELTSWAENKPRIIKEPAWDLKSLSANPSPKTSILHDQKLNEYLS